jgi:dipeptidase E
LADLLLLSNSTAPGGRFLAHALDELRGLLPLRSRLLFFAHASGEPDRYADVVRDALRPLRVDVVPAHASANVTGELGRADALLVGGGNSFRLLRALRSLDLIEAIRGRVRDGMPYLGASAGANVACPSIRTTNDMPIVEVPSLEALGLIPFQINPHYVEPDPASTHLGETRDERIEEFLDENDVPVLGLREGSWLRVRDRTATIGGTTGGRVFERGRPAYEVAPGDDVSALLEREPRFDTAGRPSA